ncbi:hypothetical protein BVRB_6g142200 [Beta vulgaris subsp. vulgaris]|nr:hypothetical protein BVRB_6g142200 [Beta vulgaris subsp. vulgaris]
MGKTLDTLLRRSFKASKFKALLSLAISRLAVLKNQKQARCSLARSDVVQLLQASQQDRALIRVEQVIKEQNMLDVFVMIEGYCILLSERIKLIEHEKVCPDELKEAISSLIFAASRCGEFPELQEIRYVFASRYGKEFTLRAIELRNNCGVNSKIIQKLSTRPAILESRMKLLKQIADENGITLQPEVTPSTAEEEKSYKGEENQNGGKLSAGYIDRANAGDDIQGIPEDMNKAGGMNLSMNRRKEYKDVAEAAQEAFLSAAYAAAAARAAVELSRSSSGGPPDDLNSPNHNQRKEGLNIDREVKSGTEISESKLSWETEDSVSRHIKVHPLDNSVLDFDDNEETCQSDEMMMNMKQADPRSDSSGVASGVLGLYEQNIKIDESDDQDESEKITLVGNKDESGERGSEMPYHPQKQTPPGFQAKSKRDNEEQFSAGLAIKSAQRLNTPRGPFSVRTRR